MSGLVETEAKATNDNLDARSVCSSVCSSMKNAELIMAAFSSHPLTMTIEEEHEKSTEVSFSQGSTESAKNLQKFSDQSGISPGKNTSINNSTEFTINEEAESNGLAIDETTEDDLIDMVNNSGEKAASKPQDEFNLSNLLDETIANVAAGDISQATKKVIENKQKMMIRHSKTQEKHYYKLKKLREKEKKKKALKRLERIKRIELDRTKKIKKEIREAKMAKKKANPESQDNGTEQKSPVVEKKKRYRRTKLELLNSRLDYMKSLNDAASQQPKLLSLKSPKANLDDSTNANDNTPLFKIKKKLTTVNFIDETLKDRKASKIQETKIKKKPGRKPKKAALSSINIKVEENELSEDAELIFEPSTETFRDDAELEDSERDDGANENLERMCLVCRSRMHQDKLNDHCSRHYYESSKCSDCDKVSSNPSNYVTHLLSHLPSQFFCPNCSKWFRQPMVYRRHQKECIEPQPSDSRANTSLKRKAATQHTLPETLNIVNQQENKRSRRGRHSSITSSVTSSTTTNTTTTNLKPPQMLDVNTEPVVVKRKQGRPRKNPIEPVSVKAPGRKPKKEPELLEPPEPDEEMLAPRQPGGKTLRPRKSLIKTRSEGVKIVESPTRKKSTRLLSISSAISSSSSTSGTRSKRGRKSKSHHQTKYESEISPLNTNEFDETVSEQMDDIDDIAVSDYEMGDESNQAEPVTVESVEAKSDQESNQSVPKAVNTNLASFATYKVKIQLRRPSNNSIAPKQTKETSNDSFNTTETTTSQTPSKNLLNNVFLLATPSKSDLTSNNPLSNPNITNTNSHEFACPECDKKFVSYYGLFAHYDHHPTLAVSCQQCQISFENHQALIAHNAKLHPNFHADFNEFKSNRLNAEQSKSSGQVSKKSEKSTGSGRLGSAKQSLNFQTKSKSQTNDLASENILNTDLHANDLSALPSIMTRTSRMTNGQNNGEKNNASVNNISNSVSLKTAAAISNHNLSFKTTGFADLSFIDFSCMNFPRIAQNYCELWPRKPSATADHLHQQLQPLHNYSCEYCGFYFPSVASLRLHTHKKHLASSELTQSLSTKLPRCPLFMTNSKTLCYEKCLDEIITQIENEQELTPDQAEAEFLGMFGLISISKISKPHSDYSSTTIFLANSTGKAKELNDSLVDYVSPIHVTKTDGLLGELRHQLLATNSKFIIELDRWKLMHSNEFEKADVYSSKIHLKPHVNLTRPLLIRAKKLKRNSTKKSLVQHSSSRSLSNEASPRQQPFRSAQLAPPPVMSKVSSQITSVTGKSKYSMDKEAISVPKLSKPLFTATSGGFSGGASQYSGRGRQPKSDTTTYAQKKKRKLLEEQQKKQQELEKQKPIQQEHKNKKRKQQNPSPSSQYRPFTGIENGQFDTNEEIIIESEKEDDDFKYYDADEKDSDQFQLISFSKPEHPNTVNGTTNAKNPVEISSGMLTKPVNKLESLKPPTLYKANSNTAIFTSAANSSILANASGMNNSVGKKSMPKLLPANSSRGQVNGELVQMPKLKPATRETSANRLVLPKPPQLVKGDQRMVPQNCTKSIPNTKCNSSVKQHQQVTTQSSSISSKSPKQSTKLVSKPSESLSLKCKFCFQIFDGQPEFFQHVIKSHPRMLEQRLNRSSSTGTNGTATSNTKQVIKPSSKVSNSNGNSNHSMSSVESSSNASQTGVIDKTK